MLLPFSLLTPAKINTLLYILQKREDGFHEIYSHLVPISFYDSLTFTDSSVEGIRLRVSGQKISGVHENNLVLKAAKAFVAAVDCKLKIDILLKKNIPCGAGLGGGSGNAAGTLMGLNRLYDHPLDDSKLLELASSLGSDVPFFLNPRPTEARGAGERLRVLQDYPLFPLLVLKPDFSVSTVDAYRHCRVAPMKVVPKIGSRKRLLQHLYNGFEATLFPSHPRLLELKNLLLDNGAIGASVSGSGSAVFALFETNLQQKQALQLLHSIESIKVITCTMLEQHQYFSE